jgi:tetratricopeptide (TPR) repeat protein
MVRAFLGIAVCLLGLVGCANVPVAPEVAQLPWRDATFTHDAGLVTVGKEDLFRLDADLLALLKGPELQATSPQYRLKHLMSLIFGADLKGFGYQAGHSTPAGETWRTRRGDCLSLTVLAYSAARALGLDAQMQEVRIPATFDRRGQLDVVNQHVNVLFRRAHRDLRDSQAQDVVVDFDPGFASRRPGRLLSEDAVLARYYNNVATEHLAQRRYGLAYAHFKAAILADPAYAASYGNLAVLYLDAGLHAEAEQLLRHAVALGDPADVPIHTLHQLLVQQGRTAEALRLERTIAEGRERDPYHWIGLGVRHLEDGDVRAAISALERARAMATGFDEVHRYLAVAYWRAGEAAKAREQIALLAKSGDKVGLAMLRRKIQGAMQ